MVMFAACVQQLRWTYFLACLCGPSSSSTPQCKKQQHWFCTGKIK